MATNCELQVTPTRAYNHDSRELGNIILHPGHNNIHEAVGILPFPVEVPISYMWDHNLRRHALVCFMRQQPHNPTGVALRIGFNFVQEIAILEHDGGLIIHVQAFRQPGQHVMMAATDWSIVPPHSNNLDAHQGLLPQDLYGGDHLLQVPRPNMLWSIEQQHDLDIVIDAQLMRIIQEHLDINLIVQRYPYTGLVLPYQVVHVHVHAQLGNYNDGRIEFEVIERNAHQPQHILVLLDLDVIFDPPLEHM